MKNTRLLILVFFFTTNLWASPDNAQSRSNGLLRFLAKQEVLRNYALGSIIKPRCSRYLPYSEVALCKSAVTQMIKTLDFDILFAGSKSNPHHKDVWDPKAFVFVAFKTNLLTLLSEAKTGRYLNSINQELYRYLVEDKNRPNMWEMTKSFYGTEYHTAMVIAALFQDTSLMKLHLAYLDKAKMTGGKTYLENKELLSRVIDTINLILDSSEENYRSLFYPREIQKELTKNIYHFYVPLFLAKALEKQGVNKHSAFTAPFMLTLSYEFVTSSEDFRYLFSDPAFIKNDYKLKDIFGGYCGAHVGVHGLRFNKSFELFKDSFARSTKDTVELMLRP